MTLQPINIPDNIRQLPHTSSATRLMDLANDRLEAYTLATKMVIDNFVNCDFPLLDQSLTWMRENNLLTGNRFCELGSGFGVAALLASNHGMESVGIEIESSLVDQSSNLADELGLPTRFYCGSFVPRDMAGLLELSCEVEHVATEEGDVYEEIGMELDEFDLFFAFPWPGEHPFFEAVFQAGAADHALLLSYRGRNGMHLLRKI